jgi:hypothetical protein
MKTKRILIISLSFGLSGINLFGHDQIVHQAITANAATSALTSSPAYAGFVNTVSSDVTLFAATKSMVDGSFDEDIADQPGDAGGKRSLNHFYDPLDNTYGKGLSDSPQDQRIVVGTNSFAWGSVSNCVGYNFPGITLSGGATWFVLGIRYVI